LNENLLKLFNEAVINKKPLILDGSMGGLLSQLGFVWDSEKWMTDVIESSPETIVKLHEEYIEAGADIITTNTFRTNPAAIGAHQSKLMVEKATNLAKKVAEGTSVLIAGSNAPAEDCYKADRTINKKTLELNHCNHIDFLIDTGVDFILNETQSHLDEIKIICQYCAKNDIPFIVSLFFDKNLKLLSGESISTAIDMIREYDPISIGFNCIHPETFKIFMVQFDLKINWGFYLNCGSGNLTDQEIICGISPARYWKIVSSYLNKKPAFIGSCCGSSPEHIKILKIEINA